MLTLVMPYYDNPSMLRLHWREWEAILPHERQYFRVIIVDDGSPNYPAADILRETHHPVDIRCLRVQVDIPWNQDGARNLGMKECRTEWALLTDMDHVLEFTQVKNAIVACMNSRPKTYYMPARLQSWDQHMAAPHPNSYLIKRDDFWHQGGYDEDFAGCYGSDGNFRKCMRAGLHEQVTTQFYLTQYRRSEIPDASTNAYGRKESKFYRANFPDLERKTRAPAYKAKNHIRFLWTEERI